MAIGYPLSVRLLLDHDNGVARMNDGTQFLIITPDGSQVTATLPAGITNNSVIRAPGWLVEKMGLAAGRECASWSLRPAVRAYSRRLETNLESTLPRLRLVRSIVAAASNLPHDPRQARLNTERLRLERLNEESDYVRVEPIDVLAGSEPERYKVTFLCRGIIGIDRETQSPIYDDRHEVEIYCDNDFPAEVPRLRWITPIWHPNVQHNGDKGVCVNKPEWLGGMGLDDLCRQMFEMVQYKNYHAKHNPPYPLDQKVAKWVVKYGEPQGIIDKHRGIFVDDKPFTRPTVPKRIALAPQPKAPSVQRVRLLETKSYSAPGTASGDECRIRLKKSNDYLGDQKPTSDTRRAPRIRIKKSE